MQHTTLRCGHYLASLDNSSQTVTAVVNWVVLRPSYRQALLNADEVTAPLRTADFFITLATAPTARLERRFW